MRRTVLAARLSTYRPTTTGRGAAPSGGAPATMRSPDGPSGGVTVMTTSGSRPGTRIDNTMGPGPAAGMSQARDRVKRT